MRPYSLASVKIKMVCLMFLAGMALMLALSGCGGGGGASPAPTLPSAPSLTEKQKAAQVVEQTPYLKDIDLSGKLSHKGGKFSIAATATRSATTVTRTILGTSLAGNCCAFVYAQFELTGTLTFNAADGTVVGTKSIDMFAYGNYELVKDAATGDWSIVKNAADNLIFSQGNSPAIYGADSNPHSPYTAGEQTNLTVSIFPSNYGDDVFVSMQSRALGVAAELLDDGVSPDTAAGDFTYSGTVTIPANAADGDYIIVLDAMDETASFNLTQDTATSSYLYPYSGSLMVHDLSVGPDETFTSAAVSCDSTEIQSGDATHCVVEGTLSDGTTKEVDADDVLWSVTSGSGYVSEGGIVMAFGTGELVVHGQIKEGPNADATINVVTGTITATVVSAPSGVTVTASDGQLTVSWNSVTEALSYNVYIAEASGVSPDNVTTLAGGMVKSVVFPPLIISGLTNGKTYYVVMTSVGIAGESAATAEVSATPAAGVSSVPSAPANVSATAGDGTVTLTWDAVDGATYYNVYMAAAAGVTKTNYASLSGGMIHTSVTSPYTHTDLSNGFTYYFVVTAGNAVGESSESTEASATPTAPPQTPSKVAGGGLHTCAALSNGAVKCWGGNSYGQLGNGTTTASSVPVSVSGITNATAVAAYYYHTCAVLSDGTVKCWGNNSYGRLGDGTTTSSNVPVSVSGITNATAVAGGSTHTCAVLSDGTIKCWGSNASGQLGDGTTTSSNVPVSVSGITNATAVSTGESHSCVLLSDGTVKCWGQNYRGQLGDGTTTSSNVPVSVSGITNATAVAADGYHSCALLSDGAVKCWGYNANGQLGNGSTLDSNVPVSVSGITNATAVSAGNIHSCALLSDGTIKCWGRNAFGQLGDGTTTDSNVPVSVSGITNATVVAAGFYHTCAVLSDGTAKCWGSNASGQLGDGTNTNSSAPVSVSSGLYAMGIYGKTLRLAHQHYAKTGLTGKAIAFTSRLSTFVQQVKM